MVWGNMLCLMLGIFLHHLFVMRSFCGLGPCNYSGNLLEGVKPTPRPTLKDIIQQMLRQARLLWITSEILMIKLLSDQYISSLAISLSKNQQSPVICQPLLSVTVLVFLLWETQTTKVYFPYNQENEHLDFLKPKFPTLSNH